MTIYKMPESSILKKLLQKKHVGKTILSVGMAAVAFLNLRLWQRDKRLLTELKAEINREALLSYTPKISVLVAAWNERANIEAHLLSFKNLTYPDIELILCAGGADNTLELACRHVAENILILEQFPGEGKQHSLSRCYEHASGELIYLTDADCLYQDRTLLYLLEPVTENGEQAVTGASRPWDCQLGKPLPDYLWASDAVSSARSPHYIQGLLGRNTVITRQALERSGGMNFPASSGTDYQLARRLVSSGVRIRYVRVSQIPTVYPETLGVYRRKQSRWLRNLLQYGWQYRAKQDLWLTVKTVSIGLVMLVCPLFALLFRSKTLAIWFIVLTHSVFSKMRYLRFTAKLYQRPISPRTLLYLLPLTLADFVVWASPLLDLFLSRNRIRW